MNPPRVVLLVSICVLSACGSASAPALSSSPSPVAIVTSTPSPAPSAVPATRPTLTPPNPVWQKLRAQLSPGTPIIEPTWLPAVFDGATATIANVALKGALTTSYEVSYRAGTSAIIFALGPPPALPAGGISGMGMTVRHSPAALSFPTDLFTYPTQVALRTLRWTEGAYELRIESSSITGDELLHISWSLDMTGAPAVTGAPRTGACASAATPEATARKIIELIGSNNSTLLGDCFALGRGYAPNWSALPTATLMSVAGLRDVGGRAQLQLNWRFASEPGGAWNLLSTYFFILGVEDGAWRVFDVNSAPLPVAP